MLAAGRKRRYFWARALIGLGMLALLGVAHQIAVERGRAEQFTTGGASGEVRLSISGMAYLTSAFYTSFAWSTMFGVLLITPAVAAGAIASERERRTIEYLFTTDLSNREIVLDKIAARLCTVGALVLATLPVLALFRLLGGVPGWLLLTHFAMLAGAATLTAAIAVTVGVWCDRARDAVPRAMGAVFVWLIALPLGFLLQMQLNVYQGAWADLLNTYVVGPLVGAMAMVHPIVMMATSAGVSGGLLGVDADLRAITIMVLLQFVAAGFLMAFCIAMVRRVHLRDAARPGARVKKGAPGENVSRSPYDKRPMLWKEMFAASVAKRRAKWVLRLGVILLFAAVATPLATTLVMGVFWPRGNSFEDYMAVATSMVSACGSLVALLAGTRAAGMISHERERDTWLSLLTTPLEARDIVAAKSLGNLYAFRWQYSGVVAIPLSGALLDLRAIPAAIGVAVVLACVVWAATAIGLAVSLRMSNSVKAVGVTTFVLLAIGVFYTFLASIFFALAGAYGDSMALVQFPPLVPMILVIPMMLAASEGTNYYPDWFPAVVVAGILFYLFLAMVFTTSNVNLFDRLCQRGSPGLPSKAGPPKPGDLATTPN